MSVIDSNNFITHLVWSGLIDKATCGELKEAIELCTVKDIYTNDDIVTMLGDIKEQLGKMHEDFIKTEHFDEAYGVFNSIDIIQQKITALKAESETRKIVDRYQRVRDAYVTWLADGRIDTHKAISMIGEIISEDVEDEDD